MKKYQILLLFMALSLLLSTPFTSRADSLKSKTGKYVIVIDPGHGGENLGSIEGAVVEKEMDMTTALAMYETLSKFDNTEVYLTRTEDIDLSLKDRAIFAKDKKADVLFCIHYNASVNHDLFGSEVWVSSKAPYNQFGYQFGYELLSDFQEKGLFIRGIKTRLNDKGTDYYGILRECVSRDTLAILIEHCHIDENTDIDFCETEDQIKQFGYDDAIAAAKFLHLKSTELGIDFTNYNLKDIDSSSQPIRSTLKDYSAPDECTVEIKDCDYSTGNVTLQIQAFDSESPLIYYSYSIDGGKTFSKLFPWPGSDTLTGDYDREFDLELQIPSGIHPAFVIDAHNQFDISTMSSPLATEKTFFYEIPSEESSIEATAPVLTENEPETSENPPILNADHTKLYTAIAISIAVILLLFVTAACIYMANNRKNTR